jgi:hypothetical protein
MVDMGESGTNILHGELKNLMLDAEESWIQGESKYHEGMLDAYATVYQLTYELAFAISERRANNG